MKAVLIPLFLSLLLVGSACAVQLGLPSAVEPGGLGLNVQTPDAQELDMMQAAGCKFVRNESILADYRDNVRSV